MVFENFTKCWIFISNCRPFRVMEQRIVCLGKLGSFCKIYKYTYAFLNYNLASIAGGIAAFLEIAFAIALLTNFKSELIAKCTGVLLLLFGLSMVIAVNCKAPLDYSVFKASAGAFIVDGEIQFHSG